MLSLADFCTSIGYKKHHQGTLTMQLLPSGKTATKTQYSSVSRNEIARFLTGLSVKPVYAATVKKMCDVLRFPNDRPIPLNQVQRIYLLGCAKQLINGGRCSYKEAALTFNLIVGSATSEDITNGWETVRQMGGLDRDAFTRRLDEFYLKVQHEHKTNF